MTLHIVPMGDIREHELDEDCWCEPDVGEDEDGDAMVIHLSADGREAYESGERKPN